MITTKGTQLLEEHFVDLSYFFQKNLLATSGGFRAVRDTVPSD